MKKTLLSLSGIALLSALIAYPVLAHNRGWSGGHHMETGYHMNPGEHMNGTHHMSGFHHGTGADYTNLTDEQKAELDELNTTFSTETKETKEQIRQKSTELNTLLAEAEPDKTTATELQAELNSLRSTLAEKRLELNLKIKEIAPDVISSNAFCAGPGAGHNYMR